MSAAVVASPATPPAPVGARWAAIGAAAPVMTATMLAYLSRLSEELSAASVQAAEVTLRQFALHVSATDPTCGSVGALTYEHVASYRAELGRQWVSSGDRKLSSRTVAYRVATLRRFFCQIAAWGFEDTPAVPPLAAKPSRRRCRGGGRPAKAPAKAPSRARSGWCRRAGPRSPGGHRGSPPP